MQRTVSQKFSQNVQQANTEINKHLDDLKDQLEKGEISQTEYDNKIKNWQQGQVLLNSIAAGLAAPTQSAAGIIAATASPALSYQIGQEFKNLANQNADGKLTTSQETAHILAHAVLGAAVAAAGDNNALAGAISAGGAEAAAPVISNWLYGEADGSKLTAEQKETVTAITGLLGVATGVAVGGNSTNAMQGSLNADSAVENNQQVRRRPTRHPLWTEAQVRQHELNIARINALINQIRRIEPNFKGIATLRDPNRPITNEEVKLYEIYLNRVSLKTPITSIRFSTVTPNTFSENLFIRNAQATFANSPIWKTMVRHRGELVIQRSDIEMTPQNIRRMQNGNAPFVRNAQGEWEPIVLHHIGRQTGQMIEVLRSQNTYNHQTGGPLHIPGLGGPVRQSNYSNTYWRARYEEFMKSSHFLRSLTP